jgi:hypothetical protein
VAAMGRVLVVPEDEREVVRNYKPHGDDLA